MATDIEIARQAKMKPIGEIATRLGIPDEALEPYGRTKAKIAMDWIRQQQGREDGKLIHLISNENEKRTYPAKSYIASVPRDIPPTPG